MERESRVQQRGLLSDVTSLLLRLACPAEGHRAFIGIYDYFRWADDVVDAPDRDPAAVQRFVHAQRALVDSARPPETPLEAGLVGVLASPERGAALRPAVVGMLDALAHDAGRGTEATAPEDLERQICRIGDAYLDALWCCTGAVGVPEPALYELSRAATLTHVLRDLEVDRRLGYCNLPPEVARSVADSLDRPEVAAWVHARCDEADARFGRGAGALAAVRPWRARWLIASFAWRYRRILPGIRARHRLAT